MALRCFGRALGFGQFGRGMALFRGGSGLLRGNRNVGALAVGGALGGAAGFFAGRRGRSNNFSGGRGMAYYDAQSQKMHEGGQQLYQMPGQQTGRVVIQYAGQPMAPPPAQPTAQQMGQQPTGQPMGQQPVSQGGIIPMHISGGAVRPAPMPASAVPASAGAVPMGTPVHDDAAGAGVGAAVGVTAGGAAADLGGFLRERGLDSLEEQIRSAGISSVQILRATTISEIEDEIGELQPGARRLLAEVCAPEQPRAADAEDKV